MWQDHKCQEIDLGVHRHINSGLLKKSEILNLHEIQVTHSGNNDVAMEYLFLLFVKLIDLFQHS